MQDKSVLVQRANELLADLKELEELIENEGNHPVDYRTRQEITEKRRELDYLREHLGVPYARAN